jgi:hypothetical protein
MGLWGRERESCYIKVIFIFYCIQARCYSRSTTLTLFSSSTIGCSTWTPDDKGASWDFICIIYTANMTARDEYNVGSPFKAYGTSMRRSGLSTTLVSFFRNRSGYAVRVMMQSIPYFHPDQTGMIRVFTIQCYIHVISIIQINSLLNRKITEDFRTKISSLFEWWKLWGHDTGL